MIFYRGVDTNGDGIFNVDQDGMDFFTYGGRETGNTVIPSEDDLFNRVAPRPLNPYVDTNTRLFRCPDDTKNWPEALPAAINHFEFVGNSYMFNTIGPPWRHEAPTVPAEQAVIGLGGKRYDLISRPVDTVVFVDAGTAIFPIWHDGTGNAVLADGHVQPVTIGALADSAQYTWDP